MFAMSCSTALCSRWSLSRAPPRVSPAHGPASFALGVDGGADVLVIVVAGAACTVVGPAAGFGAAADRRTADEGGGSAIRQWRAVSMCRHCCRICATATCRALFWCAAGVWTLTVSAAAVISLIIFSWRNSAQGVVLQKVCQGVMRFAGETQ